MTVDPDALEDVLSGLDLRLTATYRRRLDPGEAFAVPVDAAAFVYLRSGSVARPDLRAGDALLSTGPSGADAAPSPSALMSPDGGELVVAEMRLADGSAARALPAMLSVSGFAEREPAAAALAASIGTSSAAFAPRSGDPLICRMIVTTLLMTVVRAWATAGCAPAGWPGAPTDPYLRCVVAAIHEDPGRDWSVEVLAGVGAMSRTVFTERFRAAFGRSPAAYVTEVRMQRAEQLLRAGRSVSETSRALGYGSDEGFSRAFRRRTGLLPSAWRSRSRETMSA